jgi:beta-lactamase regulating signal transducer with metallopeptidase domain
MSVAGTIPLLVYLMIWILRRDKFDYEFGRKLLLISMGFYLVPVQVIRYFIPEKVCQGVLGAFRTRDIIYISEEQMQPVLMQEEYQMIPDWIVKIFLFWLICVVIFALYQVFRYFRAVEHLLSSSKMKVVTVNGSERTILVNKYIASPYSIGFFKTYIVFPDRLFEVEDFHVLYEHENTHIRNKDSFMKLICLIILCVHFFNPFAILLLFLYGFTCECICDRCAVNNVSEEVKRRYAGMLIDLPPEKGILPIVWKNGFSGKVVKKFVTKRRMINIMRKSKMRKGFTVLISAMAVLGCAATVFAYEPFQAIENVPESLFEDDNTFTFDALEDIDIDTSDGVDDDLDFSLSDMLFIAEDGTVTPVQNEVTPYVLCLHNYVDGICTLHSKNSSGGCTVTYYEGQRCSKCNKVVVGDVIKTVIYTTCPH